MTARTRKAFTLVEILIVVVILGIMAAIVTPRFAEATDEAAENVTYNELVKIRRAIDVYKAMYSEPPNIQPGNDTVAWDLIVSYEFLKSPPQNPWVGGANAGVIVHGNTPDAGFQTAHAWIYDPATGDIWAGSFDANDRPWPKP